MREIVSFVGNVPQRLAYEGRMPRARVAIAFAPLFVLFAACGGNDDPNGTAADSFIREYCSLTAKCCDPGEGNDPAACANAFMGFNAFFPRPYDAAKASACLTKLRAVTTCDFADADDACADVFGDAPTTGGSAAPGAACTTASDCAASSEGRTSCAYQSGASAATCRLEVNGAEGDACDGTRSGQITAWAGAMSPTGSRVVLCDQAADLVCNKDKVCHRLGEPGAACKTFSDCKSDLCQNSVCIARAEVGASCEKTSCVDGAYCSMKVCVAKRAAGEPCTGLSECKNGSCMDGVCKSFSTSPPLGCYSQGNLRQTLIEPLRKSLDAILTFTHAGLPDAIAASSAGPTPSAVSTYAPKPPIASTTFS